MIESLLKETENLLLLSQGIGLGLRSVSRLNLICMLKRNKLLKNMCMHYIHIYLQCQETWKRYVMLERGISHKFSWLRYFTKWPSWGSNRLPISTVPNLSTVKIFFEYKILHDFFTIQAPLQTNPGLTKSGTSVNQRFFFYTHPRRRSTPIQRAQHLPFERKKINLS